MVFRTQLYGSVRAWAGFRTQLYAVWVRSVRKRTRFGCVPYATVRGLGAFRTEACHSAYTSVRNALKPRTVAYGSRPMRVHFRAEGTQAACSCVRKTTHWRTLPYGTLSYISKAFSKFNLSSVFDFRVSKYQNKTENCARTLRHSMIFLLLLKRHGKEKTRAITPWCSIIFSCCCSEKNPNSEFCSNTSTLDLLFVLCCKTRAKQNNYTITHRFSAINCFYRENTQQAHNSAVILQLPTICFVCCWKPEQQITIVQEYAGFRLFSLLVLKNKNREFCSNTSTFNII